MRSNLYFAAATSANSLPIPEDAPVIIAILIIFRNDFWKHYSTQLALDQPTYKALWNDAHNYLFEFIMGKKRFVSNSVVSYRKRSFSSHIATSGVWGRMAAYGGTNGKVILINAGHGRR